VIDPIVELIDHEVGLLQTIHVLKMGAIVHPPPNPQQSNKNSAMRSYHNTLKTLVSSLNQLKKDHTDKEFRKLVQQWAYVLRRDGLGYILAHTSGFRRRQEGYAMIDFSKAIINAFKKLPR
jgi:UDP-N-acetyl-D-mannosaminuronic acid transferase (WecB/TagA/CpsF family)